MGQPDTIRYNFSELDAGEAALKRAALAVEGELNDLRSKLANLLEVWQGQGNETYLQIKQEWDQAALKLREVDGSMTVAINRVNNNMRDTEDTVARTLRSHSV
jgi:WXG100 family type VII secretion target